MEGCSSATLPGQVLFYRQYWDQDWDEVVSKRCWGNDPLVLANEFDRLRHNLFARAHGMTEPCEELHGIIAITIEVMP